MQNLPLFFRLTNKPVLVVGGGDVAFRKVKSLLNANAHVFVVAPSCIEPLLKLQGSGVQIIQRNFEAEDIKDKWLVISATNNEQLNSEIQRLCLENTTWVNVVDSPTNCEFVFPAIIDRSPLVVAISTDGSAPVLGRIWREKLEKLMPRWLGPLATLANRYREEVKTKLHNFDSRRHLWERFFREDAPNLAAQGKWRELEQHLRLQVDAAGKQDAAHKIGQLSYVQVPKNCSDLLTIKALQQMQLADVIQYQNELSVEITNLCRKDADLEFYPSQLDEFQHPNLTTKLVEHLQAGKHVCRLVSELPEQNNCWELQALHQLDVNPLLVPGVAHDKEISALHKDKSHPKVA